MDYCTNNTGTHVAADSARADLSFKNGTLYTDTARTEGFSVSPNVNVVLALAAKNHGDAFDDVDDNYTGYTGVETALKNLDKSAGKFDGFLCAVIEDGAATSIIFDERAGANRTNLEPLKPMNITINKVGNDGSTWSQAFSWDGTKALSVSNYPAITVPCGDTDAGDSIAVAGNFVEGGTGTFTLKFDKETSGVRITLELGTGVTSVEDKADGKSYVSGKVFTGEKGDALVMTPVKAAGVANIVVRFAPETDPANPVVLTADANGDYTLPFNVSGKVYFAQNTTEIQLNELKAAITGNPFDLWTVVVNGSHIIYYSNDQADSRDDAWSTRNPYATGNEMGRDVWYNNDVELAALADFINDKIANTGFVSGTDIAVDTTSWSVRRGPTMIGNTERYTREAVVYGKTASGAIDTGNPVGRITVTYDITELSNDARTPAAPAPTP